MFLKIKKAFSKLYKRAKNNHGQSLAEFAVTTAMMATLELLLLLNFLELERVLKRRRLLLISIR